MKITQPSVEIIDQPSGLEGIYKMIELAGRTCYKSENKITETSAQEFVNRMIESKHFSMLEHGTVYLQFAAYPSDTLAERYYDNKYSVLNHLSGGLGNYVITNYRVLVENGWLEDLKYQCEPTEFHERRVTARFILDRAISMEFVRHRVFSFTQESTRYCNYSKDKFGNELTFIIPNKNPYEEDLKHEFEKDLKNNKVLQSKCRPAWAEWLKVIKYTERCYLHFVDSGIYGISPQIARSILPNSLKTELVMTGFVSDWKYFLKLRCDKAAHPQAQELANMLLEKTQIFN